MKKAVITGANGFLGSALCRELSAQGVAITAVVRSKDSDVSRIINLKNLQIVFADMSEMKNLDRIIRDRDADVFYHFAWEGSCGPLRGDYAVQLDNVKYTCDAAVSCKKIGCSRFVSASSIMAYEAAAMMQTEQNPPLPMLYSAAKLCAGYMARTAAAAAGADCLLHGKCQYHLQGADRSRLYGVWRCQCTLYLAENAGQYDKLGFF